MLKYQCYKEKSWNIFKKKKIVGQLGPVRSAIQNNGTDEEIVIILVTMPASF